MKKLLYLSILIIALCLILVVVSIFIPCDYIQRFDQAANFISAFSSLITLIIAFLLFDRFGINKKVVNYQTDSVIKLIEKLKTFSCAVKGKKLTYQIPFSQDLSDRKILIRKGNDDTKKLIFTGDISEHSFLKDINDILNDPWLPLGIKEKMKFLEYFGSFDIPQSENFPGDKLIVILGSTNHQEVLIIGDLTFIEFVEKIEVLKKEISGWLQKYSSIKLDPDLNLKP